MRYFVDSYGCTMNQGEGRQLSARLSQLGHEEVQDASVADLVVLNTCTVIGTTERKMLRRLSLLEAQGKKVLVTGCMAKAQPLLFQERSSDAMILAPENYGSFSNLIEENFGSSSPRPLPDVAVTEVLPIAQGCLGSCTYCITRLARGPLRSYPLQALRQEFDALLDRGAKEIHLSAQDTACYGLDIGSDLPSLLRLLLQRPGDYRIRIGMMNPDRVAPILDELLDVMRDPRVYKFLHVPLQSGSDKVLARMGRRYLYQDFQDIVVKARAAFSDFSLAIDVINGFPGEEEEDHLLTMQALREIRAETVNVTRFSPRPGTAAASFPDLPHGRVSKARSRETTDLRFQLADGRNADRMGLLLNVLTTEEGKGGSTIARTESYRPVAISERLPLGQTVTVRVTGHAPTHLIGERLDASILNN
ncbi:MAG: tRNA (N(6)-L-threonylcarbamoyladenosine(37)-C(2))-methylthiotransferase [Candidatus Methanomethylophilaceae archaeon]